MVHPLILALALSGQVAQSCLVPTRGVATAGYTRTSNYAAPAAYHAPAAQYHAPQQTLVVGVPVTNLGLDYYYSVGDSLREERITQQVTRKVSDNLNNALNQAGLRQQQEALKQQQAAFAAQQAAAQQAAAQQQAAFQQMAAAQPQPPASAAARPLTSLSMFAPSSVAPEPQPQPAQAYPQPQAAPAVPAPPAPQPPDTPQPTAATPPAAPGPASLDQEVSSIFEASCVSCHAPGKATPGVQLYGAAGDFYVASDRTAEIVRRTRIYDSVRRAPHAKPMPKNGNPLPQADVDTVGRWLITYVSGK